jgi:excinuclease ABC subunit B
VTETFDFGKRAELAPENGVAEAFAEYKTLDDIDTVIRSLEAEMQAAVKSLEFERAAELRDQVRDLKKLMVFEA